MRDPFILCENGQYDLIPRAACCMRQTEKSWSGSACLRGRKIAAFCPFFPEITHTGFPTAAGVCTRNAGGSSVSPCRKEALLDFPAESSRARSLPCSMNAVSGKAASARRHPGRPEAVGKRPLSLPVPGCHRRRLKRRTAISWLPSACPTGSCSCTI